MKNVRNLVNKVNDKYAVVIAGVGASFVTSINAFADTTGTVDTGIDSAFAQGSADIKATMAKIATYAVGVMVVMLGWKYGKKIFNRVAN